MKEGVKVTMEALAKHVIGVAHKENLPVTNLQLQKVMYFAIQRALVQDLLPYSDLENMYDTPFEVWRYGPVERNIYERYKVYGANPITEKNSPNPQYEALTAEIISDLKVNPFSLVEQTHHESFWQEHESEIRGWRSQVEYQLDDIESGSVS